MARKISSKDLFAQEDLFKEVRDSADKTIKKLGDFKREIQKIAKTSQRAMKSLKLGDSKSIKTLMTLVEKANKLNKEAIAIDKARQTAINSKTNAEIQLIQIEREKQKLTQEQLKTERMKSQQEKRNNAEKRKTIKLAEQENNAYKKLAKQTRELKNESKRLGAEMLKLEQSGQKNTQAYRKLEQEYRRVTQAAKQGDAQLKKLDKTVGDNFRNVGNYKDAIAGLRSGLAQLGLVMGVGQIVRGAVGVVVDFDQAVADLSAISGQTKDQLKGLNDQAKELGETSQFTATEVTQMQIELAKLGFTNDQIIQSTEAVANFAAATGADIPSAAQVAGSALRGFGLDASEMERVVSVLGVATTKSALSFESFQTGLSNVAPVANAFGFSIEDTTALLGQLANAGFDASKASVATRNILLNLADANGDLAQELGRPIRSADDLAEGLKELQDRGIDLAEALDLTDKRSVAAFQTFIQGSGDLVEFRDSITDVSDELKDMADKRLDSVSGQFTLLTSKIQGTILAFAEANGITDAFKNSLQFLRENLTTILQLIFKVARAYIFYKGTIIALNLVEKARLLGLKGIGQAIARQIPLTRSYRMEQAKLQRANQGVARATGLFGRALGGLGMGIAIGLTIELASAVWDMAFAYQSANYQAELKAKGDERRAKEQEKARKRAEENTNKLVEALDDEIKAIDTKARREIAVEKNEKKKDKIRQKRIADIKEETKLTTDQIKVLLEKAKGDKQYAEDQAKWEEAQRKSLEDSKKRAKVNKGTGRLDPALNVGFQVNPALTGDPERYKKYKGQRSSQVLRQAKEEIKVYEEALKQAQLRLDDVITSEIELDAEVKKNAITKPSTKKKLRDINTEFSRTTEYLREQKKLLFEIDQIYDTRAIEDLGRRIDAEFNKQLENIRKNGEFEVELLNSLIEKKADLEEQYIKDKRDFDIKAVDEKIKLEEQKESDALWDERNRLIKAADGNQEAIAKINANWAKADEELVDEQLKRREDAELEKIKIYEEAQNEILDINREKNEKIKENDEEFADEMKDFEQKNTDDELARLKEVEEAKRAIYQATTNYFMRLSQERVKEIEKELKLAEEQRAFLQDLAKEGNIQAEQSLAENQRIIEEANRKKEEELKKQARIQLAQSVFTTYSQKLEAQSENPIAETIRDISVLNAFVNSLPTFFEGIEDTGKHGEGVDGKGGFHAILHPNERVIPKDLNDKIGNLSNEDLTRLAIDYQNRGILASKMRESGSEWSILASEIKELQSIIKDKPEFSAEVGRITQTSFEILERTKKGNTTIYNRFNVKA